MTESYEVLSQQVFKLIEEHLAGAKDRAGFSKLDVWVAVEDSEGNLDRDDLAKVVGSYIANSDMKEPGQWEVVAYLIQKLALTSTSLAELIEAKLDLTGIIPCEPYDEFSAWLALHYAGGVFAPKHLQKSTQSLRKMQPVKWLALALIAFHGNPEGLTDAIGKLVSEKLIRPSDIETRYRAINHALSGASFTKFLQAMVDAAATTDFAADLRKWAQDRLSIPLSEPSFQAQRQMSEVEDQHIFFVIKNLGLPAPAFQIGC